MILYVLLAISLRSLQLHTSSSTYIAKYDPEIIFVAGWLAMVDLHSHDYAIDE